MPDDLIQLKAMFYDIMVLKHPGHGNQKTHGNRYGGFDVSKESLRRLKDDKPEREKYKNRARKKQGQAPKGKVQKVLSPSGTPVSNALDTSKLPKGGKTGPQVREALAVIDKVHGDGDLPTIPIGVNSSQSYFGMYKYYRHGPASNINISNKTTHPMITTAHEVGHFLDHKAGLAGKMTMPGDFASERGRDRSPEMSNLFGAIANSNAYKSLEGLKGKEIEVEYTSSDGSKKTFKSKLDPKHISYLQKPSEAFARSYSQYIAAKSQHPAMLSELNDIRSNARTTDQWADDDFADISNAFDALFASKGYMK